MIEKIGENEERRIRQTIAKYPIICNAGEGYYIARERDHREDVEAAIKYLDWTYQVPLRKKRAEKKAAFPQYYPDFDPRQGELF